jgi:hypothetical protein
VQQAALIDCWFSRRHAADALREDRLLVQIEAKMPSSIAEKRQDEA